MSKYHVPPKTGQPESCRASKKPCPLGGAEHFEANSPEEAQQKFESLMSDEHGEFSEVSRDGSRRIVTSTLRKFKQVSLVDEELQGDPF